MPPEEREYSAAELASRWLTVDEVLGRRGGTRPGAELVSAGEYASGGAGPADEDCALGAARGELPAAEHRMLDLVAADSETPASAVPIDKRRVPGRDIAAATTPTDKPPAPDLVAADTVLASRWFTADPVPGKLAGRTVLLPFVALAELATWPDRVLWGQARTEDLSLWTDPSRMILGDDTVARIWARITVAAQRAGSPPPVNDAWIAAGCLSYGVPLATLDKRRYQYFADRYGLKLI